MPLRRTPLHVSLGKSIATALLSHCLLACGPTLIEPPCHPERVNDRYKLGDSDGINPYTDLRQAIACSKETGRPIFLFMHGYAVFSTRQPWELFADHAIRELIAEHFVLCVLMVDDKRPLAEADTIGFPPLSKPVRTIGQQNYVFQIDRFQVAASPFMVVLDSSLTPLHEPLLWQGRETKRAVEAMLRAVAKGADVRDKS
jgi:hypothetical protein